ncbi:MAG: hypothetical protein FJ071_05265 [Cyanobacteria bacterium M_DeepCast_200m_mx_001]|nr:hypothetical protein [Cyanobacteria bacterium M_DeepCast_200m_mx_001]
MLRVLNALFATKICCERCRPIGALRCVQATMMDVWLERAEAIRQWQLRLQQEPADRLLVAGLGTQHD